MKKFFSFKGRNLKSFVFILLLAFFPLQGTRFLLGRAQASPQGYIKKDIHSPAQNIQTPIQPKDLIAVPTKDIPIAHEATISGVVLDDLENPLVGASVVGTNPLKPEETFQTTTDAQGKYNLSVVFKGKAEETIQDFQVDIFKEGYTPKQEEAEVVATRVEGLGTSILKTLDTKVTAIGSSGGTHVSSKGDVKVVVPAGALSATKEFRTTLFEKSKELPGALPSTSFFTYSGTLEADESDIEFGAPVKVQIANTLGFPAGTQIPIGYYNEELRKWEDSGQMSVVDPTGAWVEYDTTHFSTPDCNLPALPPPEAQGPTGSTEGPVENHSAQTNINRDDIASNCNASKIDMHTGNLYQEHFLPSLHAMNQDITLEFAYNSTTAKPSLLLATQTDLDSRYSLQPETQSAKFEIEGISQSATFKNTFGKNAERFLWDGKNAKGELVSTGSYPYKITLSNDYIGTYYTADSFGGDPIEDTGVPTRETIPEMTSVTGRVIVNNQQDSSLGSGWNLANLKRLYFDPDGEIIYQAGNGNVKVFEPTYGNVGNGLIAYWSFDDGNNPTVDIVGGHEGEISGALFTTDTAPGFKNQSALVFDGIDDEVLVQHDDDLNFKSSSPMSISVWFKANSGSIRHILGKRQGCTGMNSINYQFARDNSLLQFTSSGGIVRAGQDISWSTFMHMAVSYDGVHNLKIYINGRQVIDNDSYVLSGENLDLFKIGASGTCGDRFSGIIDEVRIYNRVITLEEVYALAKGATSQGEYVSAYGESFFLEKNGDGTFKLTEKDGTVYQFTAKGFLTSEVDRNGNTVSYAYNTDDFLQTITYPGNATFTFAYNSSTKKLESVTDSAGRKTEFVVDLNGNLTQIINPDGTSKSYTYDADHLMTTKTEENGNTTDYLYDKYGRINETQTPGYDVWNGSTTTWERVSTFYFPSDVKGLINDFASSVGTPENPAPIVDPTTLIDEITGACGCSTKKGYTNAFGSWTESQDGLGRKTKFTRDSENNVTAIDYPNGRDVDMTYDGKGNVLTVKDDNGTTTTFTYEPTFSQVNSITDPLGNLTTINYDEKGNPTQIVDTAATVTEMTYDSRGLLASLKQAKGVAGLENTTTFEYGPTTGNLVKTIDPLVHETVLTYDSAGNLRTVLDAEGKTTTTNYDPQNNNLTSVEDNLGNVTQYQYDDLGNLTHTIDAKGNTTEFTYNELHLLSAILNPLDQLKTFTYDSERRLGRIVDAKNQTIKFEYDAANELTKKYLPEETLAYAYDTGGNLTSVKDTDSNISFTFDVMNRLTKAQTLSGGVQPTTSVSYTYDNNNNRATMVDVAGTTFKYVYDNLNRLTKITNSAGTTTFGNYAYDVLSRRTGLTYPNSTSASYSYDLASQLTNISHLLSFPTFQSGLRLPQSINSENVGADYSLLSSFSYTYNDVGYRDTMTTLTGQHIYTYDDLYRLESADHSDSTDENYSYDEVGNRLPNAYNAGNQLLDDGTYTYEYDNNGNMTKRTKNSDSSITTYTYNSENQLTQITSGSNTYKYAYDGLGRRIQKDIAGSLTKYVYDNEDIIAEYSGTSTTPSATYLHGPGIDEPIYMSRGGQTYYYHADGLGSIAELTNSSGTVAQAYKYDAFGNIVSQTGSSINPFTYTGREFDSESGLLYYRARYMDPRIGRFLQEDPIGFAGGINFYAYTSNNAINFIDPLGFGKIGIIIKFTRKALNHIFQKHVKDGGNYSKFKDPNQVKDLIKQTAKEGQGQGGKIICEKDFKTVVGNKGQTGVKVVLDAEGNLITAYPVNIPGAKAGEAIANFLGVPFIAPIIDLLNPLSDAQDAIDFLQGTE